MSVSQGWLWPVVLRQGPVTLRPMRRRDAGRWRAVRAANADWLSPWEATNPDPAVAAPSYGQMIRSFNREARAGRMLPFVVELDGVLVGQVTVSGLAGGSLRSGQMGYWVDRRVAGRGVIPAAVAMSVDHCFFTLGMHRMEVNIRPENRASLRVVEKLGFRPEGLRRRYLHIDGAWRDHLTFALTVEDVPGGLLPRWRTLVADMQHELIAASMSPTGSATVAGPAKGAAAVYPANPSNPVTSANPANPANQVNQVNPTVVDSAGAGRSPEQPAEQSTERVM